MRMAIALLTPLFLAACAANSQDQNWTSTVVPYDPPAAECTKPVKARTKLPLAKHDGRMAANEYRKLANSYDDLLADYKACRAWAKGQR